MGGERTMKKLIFPIAMIVVVVIVVVVLFSAGPFEKGKDAFGNGDFKTAESYFQKCLERGKNTYDTLTYLGRIDGINGRLDKGIAKLDQAIEMHPKRANAFYFKAVILQLQGKMRDAEKVLDEFSNKPQLYKGFLVARVRNPSPGSSRDLPPEDKAYRIEVLKGTAQ